MKKKILISILSIVITLLLLEAVLQTSSYFLRQSQKPQRKNKNQNSTSILCVGDSFVKGLGAPLGRGYPEQMQEILNKQQNEVSYEVFNYGVLGMNTLVLVRRLPEFMETVQPDILVLLVGTNDRWNYAGIDSQDVTFSKRLLGRLQNLKTVKLISILFENTKQPDRHLLKTDLNVYVGKYEEKIKKVWGQGAFLSASLYHSTIFQTDKLVRAGEYEQAKEYYEWLIKKNPLLIQGYISYSVCLEKMGDIDGAIRMLKIASQRFEDAKKYGFIECFVNDDNEVFNVRAILAYRYFQLLKKLKRIKNEEKIWGVLQEAFFQANFSLREKDTIDLEKLKKEKSHAVIFFIFSNKFNGELKDYYVIRRTYEILDGLYRTGRKLNYQMRFLKEFMEVFGENANDCLRLARIYTAAEDYEQSKVYYHKYLEFKPHSEEEAFGAIAHCDAQIKGGYSKRSEDSAYENQLNHVCNLEPFENTLSTEQYKSLFDASIAQMGENLDKLTSGFESLIRKNLEGVIELCKQRKIKLIIVGYPLINYEIFRDTATRHSITYVDLKKHFQNLISLDEMSEYLGKDYHCNELGYREVAKQVAQAIVIQKFAR